MKRNFLAELGETKLWQHYPPDMAEYLQSIL